MVCAAFPSEPDKRISRIRLPSQWFALLRSLIISELWATSRQKSPSSANYRFGQR